MANQFASGEVYADGQTVNAARLNNTVNLATAQPGLITEQGLVTPVPADQILLEQASSGLLKRATIAALAAVSVSFNSGNVNPAGIGGPVAFPGVMLGIPGTITPSYTGRIFFSISGTCFNTAGGHGGQVSLRWNGTKPSSGATATGFPTGGIQSVENPAAETLSYPFCLTSIVLGMTTGTEYWLDASAATTGGIFSLVNVCLSALEF